MNVTAVVEITVKVPLSQPWSDDATAHQVFTRAVEEARNIVQQKVNTIPGIQITKARPTMVIAQTRED